MKAETVNTLLMTGAINVENNLPYKTILINTSQRLSQYLHSLEYAIKNYSCISNIVFCENTGFKYDYCKIIDLAKEYNKNLEVISFIGDSKLLVQIGKGYGEGEIIKYCLNNSRLIKNSKTFIKLTGRLSVENFDMLFKNNENENIFLADNVSLPDLNAQVSTIIYKVSVSFYKKYLMLCYMNVNDNNGFYLEHAMGESIKVNEVNNFRALPVIIGTSGSSGSDYNKNIFKKKIYFFLGLLDVKKSFISEMIAKAFLKVKKLIFLLQSK